MQSILLVGLTQPAFVAALFAHKARRSVANVWLFAWLGVIFLHQLGIYFGYASSGWTIQWLAIGAGLLPLAHGPLAFVYVQQLVNHGRAPRLAWLHFCPFILLWGWYAAIALGHGETTVSTKYGVSIIFDAAGRQILWPSILMALSGGLYPLASFVLLRNELKKNPDEVEIATRTRWVRWLAAWVVGHFIAYAAIFVMQIFFHLEIAMAAASWVMTAEVFGLGLIAVWLFDTESARRKKAIIQQNVASGHVEQLLHSMTATKPYLTPGLMVNDLCGLTGLNEVTLSKAIKEAGFDNFFDFINAYRCEAVKQSLTDEKETGRSIIEIAYEAGFNSKSAFNRAFKKHVGVSPSEYRN